MDKRVELNKVAIGVAICAVALMVLDLVFGLPFLSQVVVVCLIVVVAVGNAYLKQPLWVVITWTAIACVYALISMELYLSTLTRLLS